MEQLKHECGVAMIRLLKPLDYYQQKYGTWMYGINKLYLMMEKQHNRGQEGAGIACVKLDTAPGNEYMFREKAEGSNAITEIFKTVQKGFSSLSSDQIADAGYAKDNVDFAGELYMGHLRYSTTGKSGLKYVHPFLRRNNWKAKNLCLCGNFNMTNVDEIFDKITAMGQYPRIYSDSYIMLEWMGHRLDREVERNYDDAKDQGLHGIGITDYIDKHVLMSNVLKTTMPDFDDSLCLESAFVVFLQLFELRGQRTQSIAQTGRQLIVLVLGRARFLNFEGLDFLLFVNDALRNHHVGQVYLAARFVHRIDSLVGQTAVCHIALRQRHTRFDGLVGIGNTVVLFVA